VIDRRLACAMLVVLAGLPAAGCAARRTSANAPQPAPAPPSATPEATADAAKRDTSGPARPPKHGTMPATPRPAGYIEEGNASWYGNPFHGRRASNGETYDMNKLTAAHRTLPFDTMVRVTNLSNGKATTVRITDRGPFVENRIIDLSFAAAKEIESVGPGIVPVRLEVLGNVDVNAGFFTVQVGAFHDRGNAERLRERLSVSYSPIFIQQYPTGSGTFYRVRVGKISGEDAAADFAQQLRDKEGFTTLVFRLDDAGSSGVN
jgi:rare lipoprotein A